MLLGAYASANSPSKNISRVVFRRKRGVSYLLLQLAQSPFLCYFPLAPVALPQALLLLSSLELRSGVVFLLNHDTDKGITSSLVGSPPRQDLMPFRKNITWCHRQAGQHALRCANACKRCTKLTLVTHLNPLLLGLPLQELLQLLFLVARVQTRRRSSGAYQHHVVHG